MPARLSRLLGRGDKEKEALAEAEANRNSTSDAPAPPAYTHDEQDTFDADNALPPPDITAGFSKLSIEAHRKSGVPTPQECIAHLKLLECFFRLQQTISSTDGLYGIHNDVVFALGLPDTDNARLLAKLAEKRWAVYVARAVDRYEKWSTVRFPSTGVPRIADIDALGTNGQLTMQANVRLGTDNAPPQALSIDDLPPIDVLLVWHAFMLNPRAYFEDCLRKGKMSMWHHNFPWELVANSIDSETFVFAPSEQATVSFVASTDRAWSNLEDNKGKRFICPKCATVNYAEWTVIKSSVAYSTDIQQVKEQIDDMLSSGTGFCDRNFMAACSQCHMPVRNEFLKVGKFCRDLEALSNEQTPMPGTLFGARGLPITISSHTDKQARNVLHNTNAFFSGSLARIAVKTLRSDGCATIADVRTAIDAQLKDREFMRDLMKKSPGYQGFLRAERMAIRRLMSRYWDNSSESTIDLVGAVIRQGSFTEKMHNIDWLHSPALYSTMPRLILKYERFVAIMANSSHMAVPTLDVDLAWHTHQLSPCTYCHYTVKATQQFIDHDDKVNEVQLNESFAWTSKQYQKAFGEPYSECTCWYCEAVRESHTSAASRLFKTTTARANDLLHDVEQDPQKSVHISAHNAIRPEGDSTYDTLARNQARKLEDTYASACSRAQKKGRKAPKRDDYYYSYAYGYPVYIPAYSPYMGPLPYTPCYYPVAPGCMALTAGGYGNCCTGTCAATVAAGGCGGSGCGTTGGCAGGTVGGCGASSSSGGCGGGGSSGGCGGGGSSGGGGGGCGGGGGS